MKKEDKPLCITDRARCKKQNDLADKLDT